MFEGYSALKRRIRRREKVIRVWPNMKEIDKTRIQENMQKDHQTILLQEARADGERRRQIFELRRELEEQERRFQEADSLVYQKKVKRLAPKPNILKNALLAFLIGGAICALGQVVFYLYSDGGLIRKDAFTATSASLIFAGALLTGLGVYDKLGKFAGAGSIVPITGFANSVAASALEFKREGFIYGVAARLFTVAGPVLVYGGVISVFIGLIHYFIRQA